MKKSWTAFYIDKYQSSYFYDSENHKMYKCTNNFKIPTWSIYAVLFIGAVLADILNRLFMPLDNKVTACLFVVISLVIGCVGAYLIMKYIGKMIDRLVFELRVSTDQMSEYIDSGREKFKRDILIVSLTIIVALIICGLSVWMFFVFNNTHILIVTVLTWTLILLCGFGFQPIKRYKFYKKAIVYIKENE